VRPNGIYNIIWVNSAIGQCTVTLFDAVP
jgi:hypothetical protein